MLASFARCRQSCYCSFEPFLSMLLGGLLRSPLRLVIGSSACRLSSARLSTSAMASSQSTLLIAPSALSADLDKEKSSVRVLDATWFMPNLDPPRSGAREFQAGERLKGVAGFFDLDTVAAPHELGLKHMLPSGQQFAEACGARPFSPSCVPCSGLGVLRTGRGLTRT